MFYLFLWITRKFLNSGAEILFLYFNSFSVVYLLLFFHLLNLTENHPLDALNSHPFYVSLVQINQNEKSSSLEVTFKIFTDDLELALENHSGNKFKLNDPNEDPEIGKAIFHYLKNNFQISLDNQQQELILIGMESEFDVTWIYMEVPEIKSPSIVDIAAPLLTEIYESQSNLIHYQKGEIIKSLLLHKNKTSGTIEFK